MEIPKRYLKVIKAFPPTKYVYNSGICLNHNLSILKSRVEHTINKNSSEAYKAYFHIFIYRNISYFMTCRFWNTL